LYQADGTGIGAVGLGTLSMTLGDNSLRNYSLSFDVNNNNGFEAYIYWNQKVRFVIGEYVGDWEEKRDTGWDSLQARLGQPGTKGHWTFEVSDRSVTVRLNSVEYDQRSFSEPLTGPLTFFINGPYIHIDNVKI